jgi:hypothetical protein
MTLFLEPTLKHFVVLTVFVVIFRMWDVGVWTGSSWLRIGAGDGHL